MKIIGIDPGVSGAIAELSGGRVGRVFSMPVIQAGKRKQVDADALTQLVRELAPDHAIIEKVGSRPGEGHVGAFSFGDTAGTIRGVIAALGIARTFVTPAEWKVALRVPADKDAARARASQLLPRSSHLWPLKKDDGKAEAALLALWGSQRLGLVGAAVEW